MNNENSEKTFRSRIGWELTLPMIALFGFIIYRSGGAWQVLAAMLPCAAFIGAVFLSTRYVVSGNTLIVKCWPVIHNEIDIRSIHRIRDTLNPLSSPAASLFGRIEVHYGKGRTCIISPRDKQQFIRHLLDRNRSILTFEAH